MIETLKDVAVLYAVVAFWTVVVGYVVVDDDEPLAVTVARGAFWPLPLIAWLLRGLRGAL